MTPESQWALIEEDLAPFRVLLHRLLRKSSAATAILTDGTGQLMTSVGQRPEVDVDTFLVLCASEYAATREMALLLGEERFHSLYHESDTRQLYITELRPDALLVLMFNRGSTLGLVRWALKKYQRELLRALDLAVAAASERRDIAAETGAVAPSASEVEDALDAFFDA